MKKFSVCCQITHRSYLLTIELHIFLDEMFVYRVESVEEDSSSGTAGTEEVSSPAPIRENHKMEIEKGKFA